MSSLASIKMAYTAEDVAKAWKYYQNTGDLMGTIKKRESKRRTDRVVKKLSKPHWRWKLRLGAGK